MKLFKGLEMCTGLFIVLLSKVFYYNVEAIAKEDTVNSANDIDFHNFHSDAEGSRIGAAKMLMRQQHESNNSVQSRGKRFIAFPVGSSFSTAVCMTTGVIGNPNYQYLSLGLNWGIAYELPNSTWVLEHANGFGVRDQQQVVEPQIKRRHRRDLYAKLETLMDGV